MTKTRVGYLLFQAISLSAVLAAGTARPSGDINVRAADYVSMQGVEIITNKVPENSQRALRRTLFQKGAHYSPPPGIQEAVGRRRANDISGERAVEQTRVHTNAVGEVSTSKSHYIELGWSPSEVGEADGTGKFTPTATGAKADLGFATIQIANNPNAAEAFVYVTPQGETLRGRVLGVYYRDQATGQSYLIGETKDVAGEIRDGTKVVFPDAFDGVQADLIYHIGNGRIEQDVALREIPVTPAALGFDPKTTTIEVATEFTGGTKFKTREIPASVAGTKAARRADHEILTDNLSFTLGRAFTAHDKNETSDLKEEILVAKELTQVGNRQVLFESISYPEFTGLAGTAKLTASAGRAINAITQGVSLPDKAAGGQTFGAMTSAKKTKTESPGVVIDYIIVPTISSYTFLAGQTYRVNGNITINGNATFQAGAVIKYDRNATLTVNGYVSCPTSGTVVFTAIDDHTIGEKIGNNPLSGTYGNPMLQLYPGPVYGTIRNLEFRYATRGVVAYVSSYVNSDSLKLINCSQGIGAYYTTFYVSNTIFCDVTTQLYNYGSSYFSTSGNTTLTGKNDNDGDMLSNARELLWLRSNPLNANTFSGTVPDGEFRHIAKNGPAGQPNTRLTLDQIVVHQVGVNFFTEFIFTVNNASASSFYEFYISLDLGAPNNGWFLISSAPPWQGEGTTTQRYSVVTPGQPPPMAFFQGLIGNDDDLDLVPDGYEIAFLKTIDGNPDSGSRKDINGDGQPDFLSAANNGVLDGDEDFDGDKITASQEWFYGGLPFTAENIETDTDQDGLPDWFERGLTFPQSSTAASGSADYDGDGWSNQAEYDSGANPLDPGDHYLLAGSGTISTGSTILEFVGGMDVDPSFNVTEGLGGFFGDEARNLFYGFSAQPTSNPQQLLLSWTSVIEQDGAAELPLNPLVSPAPDPLPVLSDTELKAVRKLLIKTTLSAYKQLAKVDYVLRNQLNARQIDYLAKITAQDLRQTYRALLEAERLLPAGSQIRNLRITRLTDRMHTSMTRLGAIQRRAISPPIVGGLISGILFVYSASGNISPWVQAMLDYATSIRDQDEPFILLNLAILAAESNNLAPGAGNIILAFLL